MYMYILKIKHIKKSIFIQLMLKAGVDLDFLPPGKIDGV